MERGAAPLLPYIQPPPYPLLPPICPPSSSSSSNQTCKEKYFELAGGNVLKVLEVMQVLFGFRARVQIALFMILEVIFNRLPFYCCFCLLR